MKPAPYGPFPYSPIIRRPRLTWPDGAHVPLGVIPNIEFFSLTEKVPAGSGGPGTPVPDIPSWSARDYGNRVGVFRLMQALDRHGIRATVALNSDLCAYHPEIIDEGRKRGWEWMGHCESNTRRLNEAPPGEEKAIIRRALATIADATGARPVGWLGSGLQETWDTLDLLAAEGCELHEAEHSHAVAVVARRPRRDVGHRRAGASGAGRHLLRERKELDIGNHPKRHMGAIRPGQARAPDDG